MDSSWLFVIFSTNSVCLWVGCVKGPSFITFIQSLMHSGHPCRSACALLYSGANVLVLLKCDFVCVHILRFVPVVRVFIVKAVIVKKKKTTSFMEPIRRSPSFDSCWCTHSHSWLCFSSFLQVAAPNWLPPPRHPHPPPPQNHAHIENKSHMTQQSYWPTMEWLFHNCPPVHSLTLLSLHYSASLWFRLIFVHRLEWFSNCSVFALPLSGYSDLLWPSIVLCFGLIVFCVIFCSNFVDLTALSVSALPPIINCIDDLVFVMWSYFFFVTCWYALAFFFLFISQVLDFLLIEFLRTAQLCWLSEF